MIGGILTAYATITFTYFLKVYVTLSSDSCTTFSKNVKSVRALGASSSIRMKDYTEKLARNDLLFSEIQRLIAC